MLFSYYTRRLSTTYSSVERLDKLRILILFSLLRAYLCVFGLLAIIYILDYQEFMLFRIGLLILIFSLSLILLLKGYRWKLQAHIFICSLSFVIWTNIFFVQGGINLVMIQYIAVILTAACYLLREKWGVIYSCLNIVPILIIDSIHQFTGVQLKTAFQIPNTVAYYLIFSFNFVVLVYTHYFHSKEFMAVHAAKLKRHNSLQEALQTIKGSVEDKTIFLATMSHELRTPLNGVIGMSDLLLMEPHSNLQEENLNLLKFSADNLMTTINDILDFNKIEAGAVEVKMAAFRLDLLMSHICGTLKREAKAKGIVFEHTMSQDLQGVSVLGDQTRLTQILFNLIGNAIKFTAKGYVKVHVTSKQESGTETIAEFKILDTGIGIPKEKLSLIFEPYKQSKIRINRQYHGTGLGLTIAERLITLLGGELEVESEEGKGTHFTFSLPLSLAESREDDKPIKKEKKNLGDLKVLVAEDNPINVLVVKKILKMWSIEPTIVENGKEALDMVQSDNFDVVLMDINMPVMDGFEASRLIRELPDKKTASVPIIALTASVGASIEHHEGAQYLSDCILKPFKAEDLRSKLEDLKLYGT